MTGYALTLHPLASELTCQGYQISEEERNTTLEQFRDKFGDGSGGVE